MSDKQKSKEGTEYKSNTAKMLEIQLDIKDPSSRVLAKVMKDNHEDHFMGMFTLHTSKQMLIDMVQNNEFECSVVKSLVQSIIDLVDDFDMNIAIYFD